jgi:hypothetical protein
MQTYRTHPTVRAAVALSVLLVFPALSQARKTPKTVKHLPAEVLTAKSISLDCKFPVLDTPFLVTQRIKQWGRFRVETNPDKADLILMISPIGRYTAVLYVSDPSNRKVFWTTSVDGGTIPGRCMQLIDLLRQRIEADEASLRQSQQTPQQP